MVQFSIACAFFAIEGPPGTVRLGDSGFVSVLMAESAQHQS